MRHYIAFYLLFLTNICLGQINLERTYSEGNVRRVVLERSGEKYYLTDIVNKQLRIYNSNHTIWKIINLPAPSGANLSEVVHVSENKINSDNFLELIYTYNLIVGSVSSSESRVIREDGTILLTLPGTSSLFVSEISGYPNKLIAYTSGLTPRSDVYSLPELTLENSYSNGSVSRTLLENSGEKYCLSDNTNKQLRIYNSNHTIWKTINLSAPLTSNLFSFAQVYETLINADNSIEVIFTFSSIIGGSTRFETRIMKEDGTILLSVPNTISILPFISPGLPTKLVARFITSSAASSIVYSLPGLTVENNYTDGAAIRTVLENSGEKYYLTDISNKQLKIYNSNHSLWKIINLPTPSGATLFEISHLSENKINSNNLIELSYSYYTFSGGTVRYQSNIIDETGTVLLSEPDAFPMILSELPGLPNKLISTIQGVSISSKVYDLPFSSKLATVSTFLPTDIGTNVATSGGNITDDGRVAITARGVVWSTSPNPTIALTTKTLNGAGSGSFISNITGLRSGVTYYLRAYATNSVGTAYGNELSFTTNPFFPTVTTNAISGVTSSSAVCGGEITNNGGATVTSRGIVWGTEDKPTLFFNNGITTNGSGDGSFISNLSGLSPATTYYVRAYATNSAGTSYGNQETFITSNLTTSVGILHDANNEIKIYPNPTSNLLFIETDIHTKLDRIIIHNLEGKCVLELPFPKNKTVNVSNLNKGIYFIKAYRNNDMLFQSKFMVN